MARIRSIKPEFFINDEMADLPPLTRLFFIGLWTQADRDGRLEDRPRRLKAAIVPYDDCDIDAMMTTLETNGHIIRYEIAGQRLVQIVNFTKHQSPNTKEQPSTIPAPYKHGASMVQDPQERRGEESIGEGEGTVDVLFTLAWDSYPLHRYKGAARQRFVDAIHLDAIDPQQIIAACRHAPRATKQSLAYFIADGTWRDHVPKKPRPPCPTCGGARIVERGDVAVPCPDCNDAA